MFSQLVSADQRMDREKTTERTSRILKREIMSSGKINDEGLPEINEGFSDDGMQYTAGFAYDEKNDQFLFLYNSISTGENPEDGEGWKDSLVMTLPYGCRGKATINYRGENSYKVKWFNTIDSSYTDIYQGKAEIEDPSKYYGQEIGFKMTKQPFQAVDSDILEEDFPIIFRLWDETAEALFHINMNTLGFDAYPSFCIHSFMTETSKDPLLDGSALMIEYCEECNMVLEDRKT